VTKVGEALALRHSLRVNHEVTKQSRRSSPGAFRRPSLRKSRADQPRVDHNTRRRSACPGCLLRSVMVTVTGVRLLTAARTVARPGYGIFMNREDAVLHVVLCGLRNLLDSQDGPWASGCGGRRRVRAYIELAWTQGDRMR